MELERSSDKWIFFNLEFSLGLINGDLNRMAIKKNKNKAFIRFQESAEMSYILGASIGDHYHKNRLEDENGRISVALYLVSRTSELRSIRYMVLMLSTSIHSIA
ncbi:hypothetical protein F8M41_023674 [Gigaspora margarita]|uniref:Uncharacterized protein n=1 Tax=Gigaspora margarita TaxID=4874 RepID=A0A8H4ACY7_GIGMA|nr:hypothetical protein F8M41_023674 [Gigaspora margarita]